MVILLSHVVVGDYEVALCAVGFAVGEHAVVVEQADEILLVGHAVGREREVDVLADAAVKRYLVKYVMPYTVWGLYLFQLVELQKLVKIDSSIIVYHVIRGFAVRYDALEIVQHHIAVENLGVSQYSLLREAVVVVPGLHFGDESLLVGGDGSNALIVAYHLAHVIFREAENHVELWVSADVVGYVEAAGDVVEGHRADAHHQYAVEVALEELEYIAVEARGVGQCMVDGFALLVEDVVGEVVVLVDDEVFFVAKPIGDPIDIADFSIVGAIRLHFIYKTFRITVSIRLCVYIQCYTHVAIEIVVQVVDVPSHLREVELQHLELSAQLRGVVGNPEASEEAFEIILAVDVVVVLHHAHEQALAETAWTNKEEEICGLFHAWQIHGFVAIVLVSVANSPEVGNAVWDKLVVGHNIFL